MLTENECQALDALLEIKPKQTQRDLEVDLRYLENQLNPEAVLGRQLQNLLGLYAAAKHMASEEYKEEQRKKAEAAEAKRLADLAKSREPIVLSYISSLIPKAYKALGAEIESLTLDSDDLEASLILSDHDGIVFTMRYEKETELLITRLLSEGQRLSEFVGEAKGSLSMPSQFQGPAIIEDYLDSMLTKRTEQVD